MRFLALGDSYTIGESVEPADSWPVQLGAMLRDRGIAIGEPEIIATTGWTTDELSDAIDARQPEGPFELVALLIGVNNQYRGGPIDEYREQFRALLLRAIGFAAGEPRRVMVLSIPDWGVTPFAVDRDRARIAAEIDAFNAVTREESEAFGTHYVDVTPVSREAVDDVSLIAADGLHPSGTMYRAWAELALYPALLAIEAL